MLALLIGFTLSITANRYDQRKNKEKGEANAIGTEYVRADLIGEAGAPKVRALLAQYLELRIANDRTRNTNELDVINPATTSWKISAGRPLRDTKLSLMDAPNRSQLIRLANQPAGASG